MEGVVESCINAVGGDVCLMTGPSLFFQFLGFIALFFILVFVIYFVVTRVIFFLNYLSDAHENLERIANELERLEIIRKKYERK